MTFIKYDASSLSKRTGETIKVQGTWELAFATWLDKQEINFIAHRGTIKYFDGQ